MSILQDLKKRKGTIDVIHRASTAMRAVASVRIRRMQKNMCDLELFFEPFLQNKFRIIESVFAPHIKNSIKKVDLNVLISCDKGLCGDFFQNIKKYFGYKSRNREVWMLLGTKMHGDGDDKNIFYQGPIPLKEEDIFDFSFKLWDFVKKESVVSIKVHNFVKSCIESKVIFSEEIVMQAAKENINIDIKPFQDSNAIESDDFFKGEIKEEFGVFLLAYELYKSVVQSAIQENIKRSIAMEQAKKNAEDIGKSISRLYHRVRQEMITTEISEIASRMVDNG